MQNLRAAILIIGNEILSGRTLDLNTQSIALRLADIGVDLIETRTIADDRPSIIKHVRELKNSYDYLFTTGGIGPTHDDITSESIAEAFNVAYVKNEEIYHILENYYETRKLPLNSARIKMAYVPEGSTPLHNKVSSVPSFMIENVFVMAGIPEIMKSTLETIIPLLKKGKIVKSKSIKVMTAETSIAETLTSLQNKYPAVDMGSYPFTENGKFDHTGKYGTTLVLRSSDYTKLDLAYLELEKSLQDSGFM